MINEWKTGQAVRGIYHGQPYEGVLTSDTRPTPDCRNMIFTVSLSKPITVYGQPRKRLEVWTNASTNTMVAA